MKLSTGITSFDVICGALACVLVFRLIKRTRTIPKGLRLPPGPPGKPIIGNVTDMPNLKLVPLWKTFHQWANKYGPIVHINILGQPVIIVNSLEVAHELFEKRSDIYSDRIEFPMIMDLMAMDWNVALMRYGDWWRRHRRIFQQYFRPDAVGAYEDIQVRETRTLLRKLQDSPTEFVDHIRHLAGAVIMDAVYGIKILPKGDPYVKTAELSAAAGSEAAVLGKFLVDIFPFLKHVPEWVPGASFKRKAREWSVPITAMAEAPLLAVKDALQSGTAEPSVAATLLENLSQRPNAPADEARIIRNVTAVAYAGGADTTVSTMLTFVLVMVLYPEVQRKAQAELDEISPNRLPTFEDRGSLPYVSALCKEVHRWYPPFPLGIGHRLMQDDVYREYFIPAGSLVIGNAWTILRDEKIYGPNTETFDPERFLRPGVIDPTGQFGFGRRICPGRYMADNSIFIGIASILKAFDISPARDENGEKIHTFPVYSPGLLTHPEPFRCTIEPRSDSARALILDSMDD